MNNIPEAHDPLNLPKDGGELLFECVNRGCDEVTVLKTSVATLSELNEDEIPHCSKCKEAMFCSKILTV